MLKYKLIMNYELMLNNWSKPMRISHCEQTKMRIKVKPWNRILKVRTTQSRIICIIVLCKFLNYPRGAAACGDAEAQGDNIPKIACISTSFHFYPRRGVMYCLFLVCLFPAFGLRDNECVVGVRVGKVADTLHNIKLLTFLGSKA